mgnify:CR=1 FL=1
MMLSRGSVTCLVTALVCGSLCRIGFSQGSPSSSKPSISEQRSLWSRPGEDWPLFLGPTGVGKSELAKILADFLFNNKSQFICFNIGTGKATSVLDLLKTFLCFHH